MTASRILRECFSLVLLVKLSAASKKLLTGIEVCEVKQHFLMTVKVVLSFLRLDRQQRQFQHIFVFYQEILMMAFWPKWSDSEKIA